MEALITAETIKQYLGSKQEQLPDKLKEMVINIAHAYRKEIIIETPVSPKGVTSSGNLRKATKIDDLSDYSKRIYIDLNQARYGEYVIVGTKAHEILPTNKKALYWKGAKHPVKRVMHPGTAPNDYFSRGVANAQPTATAEIDKFKSWLMS